MVFHKTIDKKAVHLPARVRVKICGITSVEAAKAVANAGADSIGLVFYEKSPRNVSIETAAEICSLTATLCHMRWIVSGSNCRICRNCSS